MVKYAEMDLFQERVEGGSGIDRNDDYV